MRKVKHVGYSLIIAAMGLCLANAVVGSPPDSSYKLSWSDEFDGNSLDMTKWAYRLGKRHDAIWTERAVEVSNGMLKLHTLVEDENIFQGSITTGKKFRQRYGYFEIRCKLTTQRGHWPAFWLQSPLISATPADPAYSGAEIDVFEYFWPGSDRCSGNLHWGGYKQEHSTTGFNYSFHGIKDGFHTFGVEWTPQKYVYYVDGVKVQEKRGAVSQIPQYINVSEECKLKVWQKSGGIPADYTMKSEAFEVDYVRVYQKGGMFPEFVPEKSKRRQHLLYLAVIETGEEGNVLLERDLRNINKVLVMPDSGYSIFKPLKLVSNKSSKSRQATTLGNHFAFEAKFFIAGNRLRFKPLIIEDVGSGSDGGWSNTPDTFLENKIADKKVVEKSVVLPGYRHKCNIPAVQQCWMPLENVAVVKTQKGLRYHWWYYFLTD